MRGSDPQTVRTCCASSILTTGTGLPLCRCVFAQIDRHICLTRDARHFYVDYRDALDAIFEHQPVRGPTTYTRLCVVRICCPRLAVVWVQVHCMCMCI